MKRFAVEYPDYPFLQVPLAEIEKASILQATLAELKEEGKEFVQVPLAQITWYHHISLLSKVNFQSVIGKSLPSQIVNSMRSLFDCHEKTIVNSVRSQFQFFHPLRGKNRDA